MQLSFIVRRTTDRLSRYRRWLIVALFVALGALLIALLLRQSALIDIGSRHKADTFVKLAAVLKESILAIAALAAGAWTYYVFARGRTFSPRLSIDLEFATAHPLGRGIDVLRIRIQNVGNVKLTLQTLELTLFLVELKSGQFTFKQFSKVPDVLSDSYPSWAGFRIEPKDQMVIDVPVYIPIVAEASGAYDRSGLIRAVAVLTDFGDRLWKEQRILAMRP